MKKMRNEFSLSTFAWIPIAIIINLSLNWLTQKLGLPLYLDSIGTVLVAALVGPWSAGITGILSVLLITIFIWPPAVAWAGVAAIIGIMAAGFASAGWMKIWWNAALGGLITGVVAAFLSAPIAAYVFDGVTGQAGTDVLVASFKAAGLDNLSASLGQGIMSDTLDKLITFLIVWAILLVLPERVKQNNG